MGLCLHGHLQFIFRSHTVVKSSFILSKKLIENFLYRILKARVFYRIKNVFLKLFFQLKFLLIFFIKIVSKIIFIIKKNSLKMKRNHPQLIMKNKKFDFPRNLRSISHSGSVQCSFIANEGEPFASVECTENKPS